jgi:hypothetical protein
MSTVGDPNSDAGGKTAFGSATDRWALQRGNDPAGHENRNGEADSNRTLLVCDVQVGRSGPEQDRRRERL